MNWLTKYPHKTFQDNKIICIQANCLDVMKDMEENSVDSIVTDPPYGLSFMGKKWDYEIPSIEIWKECLRVLKPGGHLLSFAGTRTQHRMACNIEDAGFEIRDMISWVYGSGFPKSLNISKQIDKMGGIEGLKIRNEISELILKSGKSDSELSKICNVSPALVRFWRLNKRSIQKKEAIKLKNVLNCLIPKGAEREIIGKSNNKSGISSSNGESNNGSIWNKIAKYTDITIPATPEAKQWDGWGSNLKPAFEPISVCRKPLSEKNIASNVLKHGTGGINIDGCRVEVNRNNEREFDKEKYSGKDGTISKGKTSFLTGKIKTKRNDNWLNKGRFPANLIHDGSEEVTRLFPETKSGGYQRGSRMITKGSGGEKTGNIYGVFGGLNKESTHSGDKGSAARFFYCAKASKSERGQGNIHPTVKPTKLMQYLVRLVTPPNGIVLDPFMGSGSTGKACVKEGFMFIGIELEKEYCEIANKRIENELKQGRLL